MILLDLGPSREARYWQEIVPAAVFSPLQRIERTVDGVRRGSGSKSNSTLEVFVPTGARALYGLLGGTYAPNETGTLEFVVNIGPSRGPRFPGSLAGGVDEVHVGLPEEYAQAVLDGLETEQLQRNSLASGTFTVVCATHGLVGSSSDFFRQLARGLIRASTHQTGDVAALSQAVREAMWGG